jgi:hypothetical protein
MEQRPKGSGEHSIAGKRGQKRNCLVYDRKGKMHMVKATLPELQLKAESCGPIHTAIYVNRREMIEVQVGQLSVSFPEQPQINGGKGRKENLHASHLCL